MSLYPLLDKISKKNQLMQSKKGFTNNCALFNSYKKFKVRMLIVELMREVLRSLLMQENDH